MRASIILENVHIWGKKKKIPKCQFHRYCQALINGAHENEKLLLNIQVSEVVKWICQYNIL